MNDASNRATLGDPLALVGTIFERKYRVDRLVAQGGFGLVYRGVHLDLGTPVALKLLRPELRTDRTDWEDLIHRFREEALALTRLRRSSVVAVLDSGITFLESEAVHLPWIALEWLDGETLREHLARRRGAGGRSPAECLALLRPAIEAIADAHDLGIVHRDIKPSNILLVPTPQGLTPRVLDFGIAKMMAPEAATTSSGDTQTDSPMRAFTAQSAAPEQLSGARTGPWTDVYAIALLLTEMLVDQPPITAEDTHERHREAFAATRPTPKRFGVDAGGWEKVLERALAVRPNERPPNARALLAELEGSLRAGADAVTGAPTTMPAAAMRAAATGDTGASRPALRRFARRGWIVAVAIGAIAAGALGVSAWRAKGDAAAIAAGARPLVLVAPLGVSGSEHERRLATTFAELLAEQLRVGDSMRIPAPDARQAILDASGIDAAASSIAPAVVARLRASAGADILVGTALVHRGDALEAEITLLDAASSAVKARLTLHGAASDVNALVRDASARVRRGLGRPALSIEDESALRTSLPASAEASIAYVAGLEARRRFQHHESSIRFEEAIGIAPDFAPAHAALALALLRLGEQARARTEAERAVALSAGLARAEELAAEALAAETRNDWSAAAESYRALAHFYPDRIDHVTSLARALVGVGKSAEAVEVLEAAKRRPHTDWDLLRIDLAESYAHARRSDEAATYADAREAEEIAKRIGARVPEADALNAQAHAKRRAGRLEEAEALFERARAVYVDVQDADNILNCDGGLEEIATMRGDFDRAIALGEKLVAAHTASGNVYRAARETVSLGLVHAEAGHLRRARELCDDGGRLYIAAHDREGEGWRSVNLAQLDIQLGHLDGVGEGIAQGRAVLASISVAAGVAYADAVAARLLVAQGRAGDAEAKFEIAYEAATKARDALLVAETALDRAVLAFERASAAEGGRFDDAERAVRAASDERLAALLDAHAARRAIAQRDHAEADRRARSALAHARASHAADAIALAIAARLAADTDAADDDREALRAELAERAGELEAIAPQIAATLALARASRGDAARTLAERALARANEHALEVQALVARHALATLRGARAEAASIERQLTARGLPAAAPRA
jgi:tRNA A-37 threonylcarbamoyl transferase component Bud32